MVITEEDHDKVKFVTHWGSFRWIRMPFILRNALASFQCSLDLILSGVHF